MPKPKLTPQEKKALKIEKKRLKKIALEEKKKQLKRDHLDREVQYGDLTVKRYEKNWREILIKIAQPRMRQEMEFAWHNFERVIDSKDFTISLLMQELRDAEEQYMLNFKNHLESLDRLMGLFRHRLDELQSDYGGGVAKLQSICEAETQTIAETSDESFEYLKTMLYRLEVEKKDHEKMIRAEYYSKIDEAEVKNNLEIQKLRSAIEAKYQQVFDQTVQFVQDYNKSIKERKKEHDELKDQDDTIQELISSQFKKMKELFDTIKFLKQKLSDMKQTEGNKLMDLQAEKQYFSDTFLTLKKKMEEDRQVDFKKMVCLSNSCREVFDYLEGLKGKGENLLTMASVCRKLETQEEKILPFPIAALDSPTSRRETKRQILEESEHVRRELELFWQRVGQAASVKFSISREGRFLKAENGIFIEAYNDYCDGLKEAKIPVYRNSFGTINATDGTLVMQKYRKYYSAEE